MISKWPAAARSPALFMMHTIGVGSASRGPGGTVRQKLGMDRPWSACQSDWRLCEEGEATMMERWRIDGSKMARYTAREIIELAVKGNVLIRVGAPRDRAPPQTAAPSGGFSDGDAARVLL